MGQSSESVVRIMSAEEIVARGGGEPDAFLWPQRRTWFLERSMRMQQLARRGGAMADYLALMAKVAQAQQACLDDHPEVPLPDDEVIARARELGIAPLDVHGWKRDPAWRQGLKRLLDELADGASDELQVLLERVRQLPEADLEHQADLILAATSSGLDMSVAPLIGAALQVYWVHMVCASEAIRDPATYAAVKLDDAGTCPCCGGLPVASVTRASAQVAGQRYLNCSLCGTQWNMVRIKCASCLREEGVSYLSLSPADADEDEARPSAIQAETCEQCNAYLKIMHTERDPALDPVADDLASLPLDVLVADRGKFRYGMNMLVFFSESDHSS